MNFKNYKWIGNILEERVKLAPNRKAIYDLDNSVSYTYQDLNKRAKKLASYLNNILGLRKGDRVAYLSRNRIEIVDGFFATEKAGLIFVPYNTRLSERELIQLIKNESPSVLFYEDIYSNKVEKIKSETEIPHFIKLNDENSKNKTYKSVEKYKNLNYIIPNKNIEDIHMLLHTGGTTGLPKAAQLSYRAILYNALNELITWNINHEDSTHLLLPLFHTGGWNLLTIPLLMAGGKVMINKEFNPELTLEVVNNEKPTFLFGAATIFRAIVHQNEFDNTDFSSLRWIMSGAAPTPREVMEKYWDKGVKFCAGYGLTEGGPNNIAIPAESMDMEEIKEKSDSVGIPFYFTETKIVDNEGNEVEKGQDGELIFSGPQIFSGYWNNKVETEKTLRNNWVYTGDMAKQDEDGFYYIIGRKKNMYISGGENVYPPEIENILYDMPEINEVCVISVLDEKWGEVGKAVISLNKEMDLNKKTVIKYLKDKLAKYKIPKYIEFVDEVPKNSVGKIVVSEVEKLFGKANDGEDVM